MRHHCVISGTGRAGTTLLVRILTQLGFETGYDPKNMVVDEVAHAGLEGDVRVEGTPYIVKSPWLCTYAHELVQRADIIIDAAIIPVRSLGAAAESRRLVQRKRGTDEEVPGGLWNVEQPEDQESFLAKAFFNLVYHLTQLGVPMFFLHYPRLTEDSDYLYDTLSGALRMPPRSLFKEVFRREVRPELVTPQLEGPAPLLATGT